MYTVYIISNAFALLKARFKRFMCLFVAKKLSCFSDWRSCNVLSSVILVFNRLPTEGYT
jgi:hypothetical protein